MRTVEAVFLRKPEVTLYHYTSQSGLLGIVKNRCIWATNIHYLNDSEEFALAIKLALREIEIKIDSGLEGGEIELFEEVKKLLPGISGMNIYVCSFSENGDLLSQWRGYCPKGNGFSVGFTPEKIYQLVEAQNFKIAPCIYDEKIHQQIIRELLEDLLIQYKRVRKINSETVGRFFRQFYSIAPALKHPTFSEEREWRLISDLFKLDHQQIVFRESISMLTPYFIINLQDESRDTPICEVIVGPTPHKELSAKSAQMFLRTMGLDKCLVKPSSIPYRGW